MVLCVCYAELWWRKQFCGGGSSVMMEEAILWWSKQCHGEGSSAMITEAV